jgi:hypothetical protein
VGALSSQWIACSASRKGGRGRPLNSVVRLHLNANPHTPPPRERVAAPLEAPLTIWSRLRYALVFTIAVNMFLLLAIAMFIPDLIRAFLVHGNWIVLIEFAGIFFIAPSLKRRFPII